MSGVIRIKMVYIVACLLKGRKSAAAPRCLQRSTLSICPVSRWPGVFTPRNCRSECIVPKKRTKNSQNGPKMNQTSEWTFFRVLRPFRKQVTICRPLSMVPARVPGYFWPVPKYRPPSQDIRWIRSIDLNNSCKNNLYVHWLIFYFIFQFRRGNQCNSCVTFQKVANPFSKIGF